MKVLLKERWLKGVNAVHIAIYSDFIGFYSDLMGFYQPENAVHITVPSGYVKIAFEAMAHRNS